MTARDFKGNNLGMFNLTQSDADDTEDEAENDRGLEEELAALVGEDAAETSKLTEPSEKGTGDNLSDAANNGGEEKEGEAKKKEEEALRIMESFPDATQEDKEKLFKAPETPKTTMEALEQRLKRYQSFFSEAQDQQNSSKIRRFKRIIGLYEKAIKATRAGVKYDYSELADPPGYAPIPLPSYPDPQHSQGQSSKPHPLPAPELVVRGTRRIGTVSSLVPNSEEEDEKSRTESIAALRDDVTDRLSEETLKAISSIEDRISQYKQAALQAKHGKDVELAKYYLRVYKGIEPMLKAAQDGKPVDIKQLPKAPVLEDEAIIMPVHVHYETAAEAGSSPMSKRERRNLYSHLELKLKKQLEVSVLNGQHFNQIGEHQNSQLYSEIEKRARNSLNDLQTAMITDDPVPLHNTETRVMPAIVLNSELSESELEVSIIRATGLPQPRGKGFEGWEKIESQLKLILPTTRNEPDIITTPWYKHHDYNPEYSFTQKFMMDRSDRKLQRVISQKSLKIEIHIKRSPRKPSEQFGAVLVKLEKIVDSTVIHSSYDVLAMNKRQVIGGKLEVRMRVREPLSKREIKVTESEWLVIEKFIHINAAGSSRTCAIL